MKMTSKDSVHSLIPTIHYSTGCTCPKCGCSAASTCDKCDRCSKCCECGEK
ncbi:hypothetical protein [Psychrobacter sp. LFX-11D]|uniref:hypothetical protein n=1 Tax=Psychrobacter sp. LFX-11D TaxID=458201 RepID=UPI001919F3D1|nr:hypothetical protein [Psychrobacter sp. LFX-11D]